MSERYEKYAKFARTVARIRGFIVRNRILLITIGAVALTTAGAYVGTKGIIIEDQAFLATIDGFKFEYGQPIEATCGGFMSEAQYQFSPAEEENWSYAVPENVGAYKLRAVSQSSFGERYGDTHYFEIKPKKATISIVDKNVDFEQDPKFAAEGLLNGHSLVNTEWVYDDYYTLTPHVEVTGVTIHNAAGADVTANYDVAFPKDDDAKMNIKPRAINISLTQKTLVYNGNEQTFDSEYLITSGTLAKGDTLCQDPVKATHVGQYSHGGFTVEDEQGKDKTMFYDISTANPKVYEITAKPVTISSPSFSKVYDGKGYTFDDRGVVTALDTSGVAVPDTFTYELKTDISENYAPGEYDNDYSYNLDNSTDYSITKKTGTLTIFKRELHVHVDAEWTYEGRTFAEDAFDDNGFLRSDYYTFVDDTSLAPGDTIRVRCIGEVYGEKTLGAMILHGGTDVTTSCYNLSIDGEIITSHAELSLAGKTETIQYDGKPHKLGCDISGLQGNDEVTLDSDFTSASITDVGEISGTPKAISIKNTADEDRSMYYTVTSSIATTTITKAPLQIEVFPSYEYVGETIDFSLTPSQYGIINGTGIAEGHRLEIVGHKDVIFPGSTTPTEEAFTATVFDADDNDVTSNYEITLTDNSTKKLHKLKLYDDAVQKEFVYDGSVHTLSFAKQGELAEDDYYYSFDFKTISEPGSVSSTPKLSSAVNKLTYENTTPYYEVETEEVKITVNKRPLQITCRPSRTYAGTVSGMVNESGTTTLVSSEYAIATGENVGLISGDYVEIKTTKNIFALKGEEEPSYTCKVFHSDGSSADNCYDVTFLGNGYEAVKDTGHLEFQFSSTGTNEAEKVYDGSFTLPNIHFVDDKAFGGYPAEPTGTFDSWRTNVGVYEVSVPVNDFTLYDASGVKANDYYVLDNAGETVTAKLTVTQRPITFRIKGIGADPEITITSGSFVAGHSFDWTYNDNGDSYTYDFKINSGKDDVTANYDITVEYDTFADDVLTVAARDVSYQYTGSPHVGYVDVTGLRPGDEIVYVKNHTPDDFRWTYVSSATYEPKVSKILDSSGKDVTSTYTITTVEGTYEITPAPVSVEIAGSRTYDGHLFSETPLSVGYELNYVCYLEDGMGGRSVFAYNGLFSSDTLTVTPKDETIFVKDVDPEYTIQFQGYQEGKLVDLSFCYSIASADFDASGFAYYKADLYVYGHNETFQYDAEDHKPSTPILSGLQGDDALGTTTYDPADPTVNNIHDEHNGHIDYSITGVTVVNNISNDRTKYYNVYYGSGYIDIDANISIDFGTYFGAYTGLDQEISDFLNPNDVANPTPELPAGFHFDKGELEFLGAVNAYGFNAFTKDNLDLSSVHIYDTKGNDVTENYVITDVYGGVYLYYATLAVSTVGEVKTYDGETFDVSISYDISLEGGYNITWGPTSYTATIKCLAEPTEAGDYVIEINSSTFEVHLYGEIHGKDVKDKDAELVEIDSSLYTFSGADMTATIYRRSLTIETDSIKDYTGFEVSYGSMRITGGSLAPGDTLNVHSPGKTTIFGEPIICNNGPDVGWSYSITNKDGKDVTSSYSVQENWGTIIIEDLDDDW